MSNFSSRWSHRVMRILAAGDPIKVGFSPHSLDFLIRPSPRQRSVGKMCQEKAWLWKSSYAN
ncbi:hypothetical protein [Dechloromonas sp. A34]|uniref:hypothetical protein n=1 Tax=Dechloromonas sp. A34 TaxID=447588 RepID=UPI00224955B7|nr:hypothetical protein [Dechloromonas sp. A34]